MWDLRWVLLGLGALVVVGVYLWSKGVGTRHALLDALRRKRSEPSFGDGVGSGNAAATLESSETESSVDAQPASQKPTRASPDRVITLRLIPRGEDEL